jgi:hypothetical protein
MTLRRTATPHRVGKWDEPVPMPARIWNPMRLAEEVELLMLYRSPEPIARKRGPTARKGQLCDGEVRRGRSKIGTTD